MKKRIIYEFLKLMEDGYYRKSAFFFMLRKYWGDTYGIRDDF